MARVRLTHIASLTERLDAVADEIQSVNPVVALAIDRISDRLDNREAFLGIGKPKGKGQKWPTEILKEKNFEDKGTYIKRNVKTPEEMAKAVFDFEDTVEAEPIIVKIDFSFREIKSREELGRLTEAVKAIKSNAKFSKEFMSNTPGRPSVEYQLKSPKDAKDIWSAVVRNMKDKDIDEKILRAVDLWLTYKSGAFVDEQGKPVSKSVIISFQSFRF